MTSWIITSCSSILPGHLESVFFHNKQKALLSTLIQSTVFFLKKNFLLMGLLLISHNSKLYLCWINWYAYFKRIERGCVVLYWYSVTDHSWHKVWIYCGANKLIKIIYNVNYELLNITLFLTWIVIWKTIFFLKNL